MWGSAPCAALTWRPHETRHTGAGSVRLTIQPNGDIAVCPRKTIQTQSNVDTVPSVTVVPRLLRIQDAARYLSSTTWFVETMLREKQIPFLIVGKRRVIDIRDLDDWIEQEKLQSIAESRIDIAA